MSCWKISTHYTSHLNMTTTRVNRSINAALDKLERSKLLTPCGRDWLIAAADPFHDQDLRLDGYPDLMSSSTVVQLVKRTIQLTVPTSGAGTVAANQNWDCSVALFPEGTAQNSSTVTVVGGNGIAAAPVTVSGVLTGGLTVSAGPQGASLWPDGSINQPTATYSQLDVRPYVGGCSRIIGMGFEVINTTSDLNKQGQVTAWRMPSVYTDTSVSVSLGTVPPASAPNTIRVNRFPPGTLANAQLLFGSRSWAAREGGYVVARQNSMDNPARQPTNFPIGYLPTDIGTTGAGYTVYTNTLLNLANTTVNNLNPFDLSGLHFTGLSFTTTLTVNVRWLVERIPGPTEFDLVVLATPSSAYDPLAIELYCQCLRDMPPGVMLSENPLGEWFRSALSKVADWAPKIGTALGTVVPGAALIGNLVGGGARAVGTLIEPTTNPLPESSSTYQNSGSLPKQVKLRKIMMPKKRVTLKARKKS